MKIKIIVGLVLSLAASMSYGHSGRTDSNGGHNCSAKSIKKGLCSGYHYHNAGVELAKNSIKAAEQFNSKAEAPR
ncbi:YHYH domain-containing protein [Kangiella sp.]|uniref:YHYH domain-containing protein n=1 Tax=Kangiella sp. TaxID=1920245 RepID=UPI003A90344E